MKVTLTKIAPRIEVRERIIDGLLSYDSDNAYPQRILRLVEASGRTKTCLRWYQKFLFGQGFNSEALANTIVDRLGTTANELLRAVSADLATFGGCAIHVNYNGAYKVVELQHLPFEHTRLTIPGDNGQTRIAVYDKWGDLRTVFNNKKVDYFTRFTPIPEVIDAEVKAAGDWQLYDGQVLWFSMAGHNTYPKPLYDSVLEDIDSDIQAKDFKNKNIRTSFLAQHMFVKKGKFENDNERSKMMQNLEQFQGAESASKIIMVEIDMDEQKPELIPMTLNVNDKLFEYTEQSIKHNIRDAFQIPHVLLDMVAGKLGSSSEIVEAYNIYNSITHHERQVLEELFSYIFEYFHTTVDNDGDYSIRPLVYGEEQRVTLATQLGVGGTQSLVDILMQPLSPMQKINALMILFGLTEEQARSMVEPQSQGSNGA